MVLSAADIKLYSQLDCFLDAGSGAGSSDDGLVSRRKKEGGSQELTSLASR